MQLSGMAYLGLFIPNALPFSVFVGKKEEDKVRHFAALARALYHRPPAQYNSTRVAQGAQFYKSRVAAMLVLLEKVQSGTRMNRDELLIFANQPQQALPTPSPSFIDRYIEGYVRWSLFLENPVKNFPPIDPKDLEVAGTIVSGFSSIPSKYSVPLSALGTAMTTHAVTASQETPVQKIDGALLALMQSAWESPEFKRAINGEVKAALREVYGIDFDASISTHKKHLPNKVRNVLDVYDKYKDRKQSVNVITALQSELEKSTREAVAKGINVASERATKQLIREDKARKIAEEYAANEIKGATYLTVALVSMIGGPEAGRVVNALGNAAVQSKDILDKIILGTMGPFGAIAGFMGIAKSLTDCLGGSDTQLILEAIRQVHESVKAMHREMRVWFNVVVDNQYLMMDLINRQFQSLYDQNGRNHESVVRQLDSLIGIALVARNDERSRGRLSQSRDFSLAIAELNRQLVNQAQHRRPTIAEVTNAMKAFSTHALTTAKYSDYTGVLEEVGTNRDLRQIISIFNEMDSVDHFVGFIPTIIGQVTEGRLRISPLSNPLELAKATEALAIACCFFPDAAEDYGESLSTVFNQLNREFRNTKESLQRAIRPDTIQQLRHQYEATVTKLIGDALSWAYETTMKRNESLIAEFGLQNKLEVLAIGPLHTIQLKPGSGAKEVNNAVNIGDIQDYSTLKVKSSDTLERKFYNNRNNAHNIGDYAYLEYTGVDQQNPESTQTNFSVILKLASQCGILKTASTHYNREFLINTIDGWLQINDHYVEDFDLLKVELLQTKKPVALGDGETTGWRQSLLKLKFKNIEPKHVQYYNGDFDDGLRPVALSQPSLRFTNNIVKRMNLFQSVRKEIIDNAVAFIKNHGERDKYLEGLNTSLRYLAGVHEWACQGNLSLGTAIANGKVYTPKRQGVDLVSHEDIARLIQECTKKEFFYDSSGNLMNPAWSTIELRRHIQAEVLQIVTGALNDFILFLFPKEAIPVTIAELETPMFMLKTAQSVLDMS